MLRDSAGRRLELLGASILRTIHKPHSPTANGDGEGERVQVSDELGGIGMPHCSHRRHVPAFGVHKYTLHLGHINTLWARNPLGGCACAYA